MRTTSAVGPSDAVPLPDRCAEHRKERFVIELEFDGFDGTDTGC